MIAPAPLLKSAALVLGCALSWSSAAQDTRALALPLLAQAAPAQSAAPQSASSEGPGFFKGVEFDLGFRGDLLRNVRGGTARGTSTIGLIDLKADIDIYEGTDGTQTRANVNVLHHVGSTFNPDYLGSLTGVSNIEVIRNTTRFYRLWVEQDVRLAGVTHSLLFGLFPLEDEFFTLESVANIVHPTGGPQGDLALSRGPAIYPNASFGLRWKAQEPVSGLYAMAAVLDGIAGSPTNPRATHPFRFVQGHGKHLIAELGHAPLTARKAQGEANEEFDKKAIALWRYTPKETDILDPLARRASWGWYAMAERTLYKAPQDGPLRVAGFLRLSGSDGDIYAIHRSINAGLRVAGLSASRPDDILSVMFAGHELASKWQTAERIAGRAPAAREDMLEVNYQVRVAPWLRVMPLVQWWRHPGGVQSVPSATVVGARLFAEY